MEEITIAGFIVGSVAKFFLDSVFDVFEKENKELSARKKKVITLLVCLLFAIVVTIASMGNDITAQSLAQLFVVIIGTSQLIHNYIKKN